MTLHDGTRTAYRWQQLDAILEAWPPIFSTYENGATDVDQFLQLYDHPVLSSTFKAFRNSALSHDLREACIGSISFVQGIHTKCRLPLYRFLH